MQTERSTSNLLAKTTDKTSRATARRIMLTTFRASSTPVMRMLMTMLLMLMTDSHSSCNATQSLTYIDLRHKTQANRPKLGQQ